MRHVPPLLTACVLLVCLNGGCTAAMWDEALDSRSKNPCVHATITDGAQQRVVVEYRGVHYRRVLLPVDADGRLAGPLVYDGLERAPDAIAADLTESQREALRRFRFRREPLVDDDTTHIEYFDAGGPRTSIDIYQLDCTAVALGPQNRPLPLVKRPKGQLLLADDARVVLIPNEQRCQPVEQAVDIVFAAAFTPLTLATDVVLVPTVIVLAMSGAFTD